MRTFCVSGFICALLVAGPAWALFAGDANDDGAVNALDVQRVINVILGLDSVDAANADVDRSDAVNAMDLQLVINRVLGFVIDRDDDGISDAAEKNLGTDPDAADSDGDGFFDGDEVAAAADPLDPMNTPQSPVLRTFGLNNGASTTTSTTVTLNFAFTGVALEYLVSESANFLAASWTAYTTYAPTFTLSSGDGLKLVYLKTRNAHGESNVLSDAITYIAQGTPSVSFFGVNNDAAATSF